MVNAALLRPTENEKLRFSSPIWFGTILSFRRNNQRTLLPYHECSRRNDMTQRLKVFPSSVAYDIAGDYFQVLRHIIAPAPILTPPLILTPPPHLTLNLPILGGVIIWQGSELGMFHSLLKFTHHIQPYSNSGLSVPKFKTSWNHN